MTELVFLPWLEDLGGGYLNDPKLGLPGCKVDKMIIFTRGNSRPLGGSLQFDSTAG